MSSSGPHDEFLALCAISTSGRLSEEEQNRLKEHLAVCPACREALRQYEAVVDQAIAAIASEESARIDPGPRWSQARAEKAFFERLAKEKRQPGAAETTNSLGASFCRVLPIAPESTWRHVWMLYAAGILLFITLGFCAYWVGMRRGADVAKIVPPAANARSRVALQIQSLEEQLSDAAHEQEIARAQIAERDKALSELRRRLDHQAAAMKRMKEGQDRLENDLRSGATGRQELIQQHAELARKLEAAQSESQALQRKLASLTNESAQQTAQAKALEAKVKDLTQLLQDRETKIDQQEQLLAHDRDIRELMGARDLYIAEVYDVGDNGDTRKPFGRVFYTRGKSLIFYAYDLDQQGAKRAQAFQAWGRRGPNWQHALNLGIFYEDNASKKRWVLKMDDPKTLAQIDAVFVTVEPHGGSQKPSGKPLLFAYLRVNPNHP